MNYCYALSSSASPSDYRYIGETYDINGRLYEHLYTARTSKKRWPLLDWISKHIRNGEEILITPICMCERDTYEIDLIARGRSLGWKLLNIQDGGKSSGGMKNKKHSSASKDKMSKSRKGKAKLQTHKDNISAALTNRVFSDEHLANMSKSAKTKPRISCEHCGILVTKTNYTKWHGNNCGKIPQSMSCPHCNKSGQKGGMYRWHFDNCKYRSS